MPFVSLYKVVIDTKIAPPFSMKNGDKWKGLSIELWQEIVEKLKINYKLKQLDLPNLLKDITNSHVVAGLATITVLITSTTEKSYRSIIPLLLTR